MVITPSKTIKLYFKDPPESKEKLGIFEITGRPPSLWQHSYQGAHVTAYHLIKHGLIRILNSFSLEETECLHFQHREQVRTRRKKLYNYISSIAILDPKRIKDLFEGFRNTLESYNKIKTKKKNIKLKDSQFYKKNLKKLQTVFENISALILTFYNKIEKTSFYPFHLINISEQEDNKQKEDYLTKTVIPKLDKQILELLSWLNNCKDISTINMPAFDTKIKLIVKSMQLLIDYSELEEQALKRHNDNFKEDSKLPASDKKKLTTRKSFPRDNESITLVEMIARHIHIFYAVYSELEVEKEAMKLCKDYVVENFIREFLGNKWKNTFNKEEQIKEIISNVNQKIIDYKKLLEKHKFYENYIITNQLNSSSDEESISSSESLLFSPIN